MAAGIITRQTKRGPRYTAWVWSPEDGKKIYRTFANRDEARSWRADAYGQVRRKELRAPSNITLREAAPRLGSRRPSRARSSLGAGNRTSPVRSGGTEEISKSMSCLRSVICGSAASRGTTFRGWWTSGTRRGSRLVSSTTL